MINQKENIENNIFDSILVALFLLFILSLCNDDSNHFPNRSKPKITCENIVCQSNAIVFRDIPITLLQDNLIPEINLAVIVNHTISIISANRKTSDRISIQKDSVAKSGNLPTFIIQYHVFRIDNDDVPLLS